MEKFTHVASHDLQEPLRKIATYGLMLQERSKDILDEKSNDYLSKIVLASQRIRSLVNALVDFSLFGQQDTKFEKTDLNRVVQNVTGDLELKIQNTNAVIEVGNLPTIDANVLQLEQLFQNIISNAIKFRIKDVSPLIKIHAEIMGAKNVSTLNIGNEDFCKITIEDNGIGFDEAYLQQIFTLFKRLDTNYEGTGLGLAICKKIVDNHHGTVTAESSPGKGTKFIILLPVKQQRLTAQPIGMHTTKAGIS